jgi:uncharacterized membrane protein YvlD (DUF360 family)
MLWEESQMEKTIFVSHHRRLAQLMVKPALQEHFTLPLEILFVAVFHFLILGHPQG